jgi:hypothetical protein
MLVYYVLSFANQHLFLIVLHSLIAKVFYTYYDSIINSSFLDDREYYLMFSYNYNVLYMKDILQY